MPTPAHGFCVRLRLGREVFGHCERTHFERRELEGRRCVLSLLRVGARCLSLTYGMAMKAAGGKQLPLQAVANGNLCIKATSQAERRETESITPQETSFFVHEPLDRTGLQWRLP